MSNALEIERRGGATIVRFIRPEIRSPLSVFVLEELAEIVGKADGERMIFTGTGNVFASGADLREIAAVTPEGAREFGLRGQRLMNSIAELECKTIAAVNGFCFGGALDLALACDVRIASAKAQFAHPGVGLGIITGWGGTQRLPRKIGQARTLEMLFTAERVGADEALRIGLVDAIADDVVTAALDLRFS
jgi:enoyl-CoA hydratase